MRTWVIRSERFQTVCPTTLVFSKFQMLKIKTQSFFTLWYSKYQKVVLFFVCFFFQNIWGYSVYIGWNFQWLHYIFPKRQKKTIWPHCQKLVQILLSEFLLFSLLSYGVSSFVDYFFFTYQNNKIKSINIDEWFLAGIVFYFFADFALKCDLL